jgi:hypothetical protein
MEISILKCGVGFTKKDVDVFSIVFFSLFWEKLFV